MSWPIKIKRLKNCCELQGLKYVTINITLRQRWRRPNIPGAQEEHSAVCFLARVLEVLRLNP